MVERGNVREFSGQSEIGSLVNYPMHGHNKRYSFLSSFFHKMSFLSLFLFIQSCGGEFSSSEYKNYDEYLKETESFFGEDGSRIELGADGQYHVVPPQGVQKAKKTASTPAAQPQEARARGYTITKDYRGHGVGPKRFKTVIIDAGHGGSDSGATVAGMMEKHYALDMARKLRNELQGEFQVVMLRNDDRGIGLDRRVTMTMPYNSAIFLSLHLNYSRAAAIRGPETYYFRVDSYSLGKRIQQAMAAVSPREQGNVGLRRRRLRLTRNTEVPSVLLELGYLTNAGERNLFKNVGYRLRLAKAIADAIRTQNRLGDQGMGALPRPLNRPPSRSTDTDKL